MASTTIHRAEVTEWNKPPKYISIPFPPAAGSNETQIRLLAAGVHRVVRSRADGTHYSASILPHIPGTDGVGIRTSDNKPVYFSAMTPQGGSMVEVINLPSTSVVELPEGVDAENVAAMVNPAMSSWMALTARADPVEKGFSALILGVTSASGKVGVSVAREMGAGRVVGVARNENAIRAITGVDEAIVLKEKVEETEWEKMGKVDVILDYLYGPPTQEMFKRLPKEGKMQYVQVGGLAGEEIALPSAVLRSKNITLRGSGPGAWSLKELRQQMPGIVKVAAGLERQKLRIEKLANIERVWTEASGNERLVFVP